MTLTTEQLRARAKFWREKAVEAKWESVSIAQDMLLNADAFDELAANREAQPVALVDRRQAARGGICWRHGGKDLPHGTELFTAPPAPAVPDTWIACSERMPDPNKYVQVSNGAWVGVGMYNDADHLENDERWQDERQEFIDLLYSPVTHWMPLPAAPKGGK
ncbi:DUF551 domain-containing protein [Serratia marcescens]|nr:DUF551 domain-containing protein [Serratia marcescens]